MGDQPSVLANSQQLHLEGQLRIWRYDPARAAGAVAELWGDRQLPFAPDFHARDPFVPSFNDLAGAERKLERVVPVFGRIELLPALQPTRIMNLRLLTALGHGACSSLHVLILQSRSR